MIFGPVKIRYQSARKHGLSKLPDHDPILSNSDPYNVFMIMPGRWIKITQILGIVLIRSIPASSGKTIRNHAPNNCRRNKRQSNPHEKKTLWQIYKKKKLYA